MAWKSVQQGFEFLSSKKDIKDFIKEHVALGWVHELTRNSHNKLSWPYVSDKNARNTIVLPGTPSDNRGIKNIRSDARKIMAAWPANGSSSSDTSDTSEASDTSTGVSKTSFNSKYASASSEFYNFHSQYQERPPHTYDLCMKGADLAGKAYNETRQGHFKGFESRYRGYAQDILAQQEQLRGPGRPIPRGRVLPPEKPQEPLYPTPEDHPDYLIHRQLSN